MSTNSNIVNNRDYGVDEGSKYNTNGPIGVENTYLANNAKDLALYTHAITATGPIAIPSYGPSGAASVAGTSVGSRTGRRPDGFDGRPEREVRQVA